LKFWWQIFVTVTLLHLPLLRTAMIDCLSRAVSIYHGIAKILNNVSCTINIIKICANHFAETILALFFRTLPSIEPWCVSYMLYMLAMYIEMKTLLQFIYSHVIIAIFISAITNHTISHFIVRSNNRLRVTVDACTVHMFSYDFHKFTF